MSVTQMFSTRMPSDTSRPRQDKAAAPAPEVTSLTSSGRLPTSRKPFRIAAQTTTAVPC
jgi:hypothetical protein